MLKLQVPIYRLKNTMDGATSKKYYQFNKTFSAYWITNSEFQEEINPHLNEYSSEDWVNYFEENQVLDDDEYVKFEKVNITITKCEKCNKLNVYIAHYDGSSKHLCQCKISWSQSDIQIIDVTPRLLNFKDGTSDEYYFIA